MGIMESQMETTIQGLFFDLRSGVEELGFGFDCRAIL